MEFRNVYKSPDPTLKHVKFGFSYSVLFAQPPCVFPYFLYMSQLYLRFPIYNICCICFSFPACTPWLILLDLKRKKHKLLWNFLSSCHFPSLTPKLFIQSLLSSPQIYVFPSGRKPEFYNHNAQHLKAEFCADFYMTRKH
jgi:hypothetical protein